MIESQLDPQNERTTNTDKPAGHCPLLVIASEQPVIASVAKQSSVRAFSSGLLRRFAARNDDATTSLFVPPRHCGDPLVIASEAKQSRVNAPRLDCFTNGKLLRVRNDDSPPVIASERHIAERSNPG
ncbi:MAG: hypothetical protein LBT00_15380 [Spirochaetaceae bacterium]|jgi:hypothetical protein|nr:hypothetical protein [Spirochaetaceae bacterium]